MLETNLFVYLNQHIESIKPNPARLNRNRMRQAECTQTLSTIFSGPQSFPFCPL